jgi:hypothetical protein
MTLKIAVTNPLAPLLVGFGLIIAVVLGCLGVLLW